MPLISHRGAKGLGPENTLATIRAAAKLGVDYIEFDVQRTLDDQPVVFHDPYTKSGALICQSTLHEIQQLHPEAPTLHDALLACGASVPLVELKSKGSAEVAEKYIKAHKGACITSFDADELKDISARLKDRKIFLMQRKHPFGILKKAKQSNASGIGINKNWFIMLPHYYWHGRRNNLEIYTYTVNSTFLAKLLVLVMPNLLVCTDKPNKNAFLIGAAS
jgi:glycerophosphoryl diester phosphodiesterase